LVGYGYGRLRGLIICRADSIVFSSGNILVHAYVGAWLLCTNVKSAII
jgi:hypothetical protein